MSTPRKTFANNRQQRGAPFIVNSLQTGLQMGLTIYLGGPKKVVATKLISQLGQFVQGL